MNSVITAKILEVTAQEPRMGQEVESTPYSYKVYEFPNGLILCPEFCMYDSFFEDRGDIQPNGLASVIEVQETGETEEFTREEILIAVQNAIKEHGEDSVPKKHFELWKEKHYA